MAAGAVTCAFGASFLIAAMRIPESTFANSVVQPRDVPIVIGAALVLSGLALTVQGLLRGRRSPVDQQLAAGTELGAELAELQAPPATEQPVHLVVLAALFVAYLLAFIPVGFLVSTLLFLLLGTTYLEPSRWVRNLVFSAVLSLVIYLLFGRVLGVPLPSGVLDLLL